MNNKMLEKYVIELLHIDDGDSNKLINLESSPQDTFIVTPTGGQGVEGYADYFFRNSIKVYFGKSGHVALKDSSASAEQIIGFGNNVVEWRDAAGGHNVEKLKTFIDTAIKSTSAKGNNPLFLSLGAVKWSVRSKGDLREIVTPLIIFPIKLVRSGDTTPVAVEFVDDDIYFNDCFYYKMRESVGEDICDSFPRPQELLSDRRTIDIDKFDLNNYFEQVELFIKNILSSREGNATAFELQRDTIAIAKYEHEDMCVYYDIRRNEEDILKHSVVQKVFGDDKTRVAGNSNSTPKYVLRYDSVQEDIIRRAIGGENIKIQGPPGTGKTQTIANLIATLIGSGKKVLFVSKKLSALSEVYNKLPAQIQNFALRLTAESEKDIAVATPNKIHSVLRKRLNLKESEILGSVSEKTLIAETQALNDEKNKIMNDIAAYYSTMFANERFHGSNFYDVLDKYCKNYNCGTVVFADDKKILTLSAQNYEDTLLCVENASNCYNKLTANNTHTVAACPWFGALKDDCDQAFRESDAVRKSVEKVVNCIGKVVEMQQEFASLTAQDFIRLTEITLSETQIKEFASFSDIKEFGEQIQAVSEEYLALSANFELYHEMCPRVFAQESHFPLFLLDPRLKDFKLATLQRISNAENIYNAQRGMLSDKISLSALKTHLASHEQHIENSAIQKDIIAKVFDIDLGTTKNAKMLEQAYNSFRKYIDKKTSTLSRLDLVGQNTMRKLKENSLSPEYMKNSDIMDAIDACKNYYNELNLAVADEQIIFQMLYTTVKADDMQDLYSIIKQAPNFATLKEFVGAINKTWREIEGTVLALEKEHALDWTTGELFGILSTAEKRKEIVRKIAALNELHSAKEGASEKEKEVYPVIKKECSAQELCSLSSSILATASIVELFAKSSLQTAERGGFGGLVAREIVNVRGALSAENIAKYLAEMVAFVDRYMENSLYSNLSNIRLNELKIFATEISDQTKLSAMREFGKVIKNSAAVDLQEFFRPFVYGYRKDNLEYSFAEIFEHSVSALTINAVKNALGERQFDFSSQKNAGLFARYGEVEKKLFKLNAKNIALGMLRSVDTSDPMFKFLDNERSKCAVCRLMFKNYSKAIMSLMNCFIMSPSTVSVLFRDKIFDSFDVVIVDEASQMAPQYLLPAICRGAQSIVVGDEYQMPPIKHFARNTLSQEVEEGYEPVASSLDVIKNNNAFTAITLRCHYRSLTESLIAYSQRYYEAMLTFPSAVPFSQDIGMRDIYLPAATAVGGENPMEADSVVRVLQEHFDKYYSFDKETSKASLAQSVGVVVFGERQAQLITSKINEKPQLAEQIAKVKADFDGADERVFFIRPVEKVQGQEIDHMIFSLTYGKNEKGKLGSFGQLSVGKWGEKIFNVSVSRAKTQMTVVHSILAEDIDDSAKIAYIQQFLQVVKEFAQDGGHRGFFSNGTDSNFVKNVADFVEKELGLASERVVINYGATEKSLRVPIAILSEDCSRAEIGILCETKPMVNKKQINYFDYNIRYADSLVERGWKTARVFVYDWVNNADHEKQKLIESIKDALQS